MVWRHLVIFFLLVLAVYALLARDRVGALPFWGNHSYFSEAYVQGHLGLQENSQARRRMYPEIVHHEGKIFNPQAPMPAILMMPLAFFFGNQLNEFCFSIFLGGLTAVMFMSALFNIRRRGVVLSVREIWIFSILLVFGTPIPIYSAFGVFWFLNHVSAIFFVTMALLLWTKDTNKRNCWMAFWIGVCFGCAFLSRYNTILLSTTYYLFLLFYEKYGWREKLKRFLSVSAGLAILVCIFMLHNWLRFGNVTNAGYDAYAHGKYWAWTQVGPHLCNALLLLPIVTDTFPWLKFSTSGTSIFIMTPLLLWLLRLRYTTAWQLSLLWGCMIVFIFLMGYATNGAEQIGYRYLLELYPFLVFILAISSVQIKKGTLFYSLLTIGIILNILGSVVFFRWPFYSQWTIRGSYIKELIRY